MKANWIKRTAAAAVAALLMMTAAGCAAQSAQQTDAPKETEQPIEATVSTEEPQIETEPVKTLSVKETARKENGTESYLTYPVLEGDGAEKFNAALLSDLEETIRLWGVDPENGDTYQLELVSSALENGIASFFYRGMFNVKDSAHPSNVMIVENYNMATGERLSTRDLIDPADACEAVLNGSWTACPLSEEFFEDQKGSLTDAIETMGKETVVGYFQQEAFGEYGLATDNGAGYYIAEDGTASLLVYFPVAHALGDYVIGQIALAQTQLN